MTGIDLGRLGRRAADGVRRLTSRAADGPVLGFAVLAVLGLSASTAVVLAGGRVGPVLGSTPLTSWFGILSHTGVVSNHRGDISVTSALPGLTFLAAIVALVVTWLLAQRSLRARDWSPARIWGLAAIWATPLMLGPPLLSSDVYAYAAQGILAARGLDPSTTGIAALGDPATNPAVAAVDPTWRQVHSPYGPVATVLEHGAYHLGGTPLGAVVLLRVLAVASVAAIGLTAAAIAGPEHRRTALTLTILNPLLLLHVVAAAHLEGVLCACALAAFLALQRGHPHLAVALGCTAGMVKAPAIAVAVVVVVVVVCREAEPGRRALTGAGLLTAAAATMVALSLLVPDGWGWLGALTTPGQGFTPDAPSTFAAILATPLFVWTGVTTFATVSGVCQIIAMGVAAVIGFWLLKTADRRTPAATAGQALLTASVLGPVIYPWYFLWGVVLLAPAARGRTRDWAVKLSALGAVMAVQGLATLTIGIVATLIIVVMTAWVMHTNRWTPQFAVAADSVAPGEPAGLAGAATPGPVDARYVRDVHAVDLTLQGQAAPRLRAAEPVYETR